MMILSVMCFQHDIMNSKMQLLSSRNVVQPTGTRWNSLEEIIGTYSPGLPEPVVNIKFLILFSIFIFVVRLDRTDKT